MARLMEPDELTPAARAALVNAHFRQGSPLPIGTAPVVAQELWAAGLVSPRGNLTGIGAIVRSRCIDAALAAMEEGL